jgi:hypothetical protein
VLLGVWEGVVVMVAEAVRMRVAVADGEGVELGVAVGLSVIEGVVLGVSLMDWEGSARNIFLIGEGL